MSVHHEPRCSGTKRCRSCMRELHVLAFAADSENLDGLHGTCRECTSKAQAVSPSALQRKQAAAERTVRRLQMSIKARSPR